METLVMYNMKGGVGKTAGCVNLASLAALEKRRVLIWDLDPQGAASFYFKVSPGQRNNESKKIFENEGLQDVIRSTNYEYIDLVPASLSSREADLHLKDIKHGKKRIRQLLQTVKDNYDYVFLDCPSGLSFLHEACFQAAKTLVMPVIPTTLSLRTYQMVMAFLKTHEFDIHLHCYFSMADLRKKLHNEIIESCFANKDFLKNYIPYLSDVEKMGIFIAPVIEFSKSGYAAQCYKDIWQELSQQIFTK